MSRFDNDPRSRRAKIVPISDRRNDLWSNLDEALENDGSHEMQARAYQRVASGLDAIINDLAHAKHLLREMTRLADWMQDGYSIEEYRAFFNQGILPEKGKEA